MGEGRNITLHCSQIPSQKFHSNFGNKLSIAVELVKCNSNFVEVYWRQRQVEGILEAIVEEIVSQGCWCQSDVIPEGGVYYSDGSIITGASIVSIASRQHSSQEL